MSVKLLTEHDLEFLNLTGGCTSSFESTLVKMPRCWKSRVMAHMYKHTSYQNLDVNVWPCQAGSHHTLSRLA